MNATNWLGIAILPMIFINFFLKSWWLSLAALICGIGFMIALLNDPPINVYLFCAVAVVAVGQLISLIIAKHVDA